MMNYRHIEELDHVVRMADQAVRVKHLHQVDELTDYLYAGWYSRPAPTRSARTDRRHHSAQRTVGVRSEGCLLVRQEPIADTDGWWRTSGPMWSDDVQRSGSELVRLYLSVEPEKAARVIAHVTAHAMSWHEPWGFKSTTDPGLSVRPDATVLYLPIGSLDRLHRDLRVLLERLRPMLRTATPAFTLRIGTGAALAQNPANGGSFGEHRCGLVAQAVLSARGCAHKDLLSRTSATFAAAGIDPERPYRERRRAGWDRRWRSY